MTKCTEKTDNKSSITHTYAYDAFGNLSYGVPLTTNYYGYNGESTNTNTGLQYLRARYYNPENGNFTTEDTYAGSLAKPLTQNRYTYVANNPLGYTDPTGHSLLSRIGGGLKSAVGAITHAGGKLVDVAKKVILPLVPVIVSAKNTIFPSKDTGTNKNKQNQSRFNSKDAKKIYSDFKTYASVATQIIREEVKRELCSDKQVHIQYQGTPKDWFTLGLGLVEIKTGVKSMGLGLGLTGVSGGAASEISIPMALAGAAAVSVGIATTSAALLNMFEIQVSRSASDSTSSSDETQSNKKPKQGNSGTGNNAGKSSGSTQGGGGSDALKNGDAKSISNMSKEQLQENLPEGWKYTEHNGRIHIKDEAGKIRIRIDPADKVTQYPHMHVYDNDGNLLDILGNIVDRKSPAGHIPYMN